MKPVLKSFMFMALFLMIGCAPVVIGAGATGGYKVATDERGIGRIWDDSAITAEINAELIKDPAIRARKIDVDTIDGHVILTGIVSTERESKKVITIAKKVSGVRKVTNNIQIGSRTFGQAVDDQLLGNRIKAKLILEPGIRSLNIDVDVVKGVVTLTGIVSSGAQKRKIMELAQTVTGVIKVVDNLKVK